MLLNVPQKIIKLIRDGEKRVGWLVGRERFYTYRYTVTTRMTAALRWGSDVSHFQASLIVRGPSHKIVSRDFNL